MALFFKPKPKTPPAAEGEPRQRREAGKTPKNGSQTSPQGPTNTQEIAEKLGEGRLAITDIIAPPAMEVDFDYIKIGEHFFRTLFVSGYPRFVGANWLSPVINFDHTLEISMFYYPVESKNVLDDLRRKIAEMEATLAVAHEKGQVPDPAVTAALEDAEILQQQLVRGIEKFFQFSFYITIPAQTREELDNVTKRVEAVLGSLLLISKHATLQMEQAFKSTTPVCLDHLSIKRNMDTTSLATTFPFTSSELTANEGILYGINEHNGSLVIFDRFSLENANSVVFAKSGAGKSYLVKLESLRSLMFGTEILVVDPEKEYETIAKAVGGDFITFSQSSPSKVNPFDISGVYEEGENELGLKVLSLHTIFKVMMGGDLNPQEEVVLDRALVLTYKKRGITQDPSTHKNSPPVLRDFYEVLNEIEGGAELANRIERYVTGALSGIFDQPSNIDIQNTFTVFSTRDLEEAIRPIAMYIILDFIWTRIRRETKKRILVVDEAWYLMQHPDTAAFLYSIAKRARKYYLGLTTITQDVGDFLRSEYGKAIVTNSSIQILLKQHPAAIDEAAEVFYLSEGEKNLLLSANIGEGLFFAGPNHVAIQVVASPSEHPLVTSSPKEILEIKKKLEEEEKRRTEARKIETPEEQPPPAEEADPSQEAPEKAETAEEPPQPPEGVTPPEEKPPDEKGQN